MYIYWYDIQLDDLVVRSCSNVHWFQLRSDGELDNQLERDLSPGSDSTALPR